MIKKFLSIFAIFIFSQGITLAQEEILWQQVAPDSYINPEGIVGTEEVYGFSFILKSFNKGQYEPVGGREIWYTIAQYTIDCTNQTYKIGVIDSYGYSDNFINGDYNRFAKFQPIVSGTAVSNIALKLCRAL